MSRKRWTREEDTILKKYYGKISRQEIANKLNRSHSAISYRAKAIGCLLYNYKTRGQLMRGKWRHYSINMSFFDIPNTLNCYWAGFIAADGCVKEKRKEVVIALQEIDSKHLRVLCKDCCFDGPIKKVAAHASSPINGKTIYSGPSVRLELYGVYKWIENLRNNFNITEKKSLTLQPPMLVDELALSFIAGYLDGDGCICCSNNKISLSFRGTKSMLEWIKSIFDQICPLDRNKLGKEARVGIWDTHPLYIVTGKRAIHILNKITDLGLPQITRKWSKLKKGEEKKT